MDYVPLERSTVGCNAQVQPAAYPAIGPARPVQGFVLYHVTAYCWMPIALWEYDVSELTLPRAQKGTINAHQSRQTVQCQALLARSRPDGLQHPR
jgi:hypothetical protein